jgi:hypothetical protein
MDLAVELISDVVLCAGWQKCRAVVDFDYDKVEQQDSVERKIHEGEKSRQVRAFTAKYSQRWRPE